MSTAAPEAPSVDEAPLSEEPKRRPPHVRALLIAGSIAGGIAMLALGFNGGGHGRPEMVTTNPGETPSWASEPLARFDDAVAIPGGTVTGEFGIENVGDAPMSVSFELTPPDAHASDLSATLTDKTSGETIYVGALDGQPIGPIALGEGEGSRHIFRLDLTLAADAQIAADGGTPITPQIAINAEQTL